MMQKFKAGLVFGAGFSISFLLFWYMAAYWVTPILTSAKINQINRELSAESHSTQLGIPATGAGGGEEKPFHELPIEKQIETSSVIALARYEKSPDGKMRAIIKDFLKKDPGTTIYYDVGDEYANSSYYPKENTVYGDGVIIFFMGSPAMMRMSTTFSGDRIGSLGDLPLALFKKKCEKSAA